MPTFIYTTRKKKRHLHRRLLGPELTNWVSCLFKPALFAYFEEQRWKGFQKDCTFHSSHGLTKIQAWKKGNQKHLQELHLMSYNLYNAAVKCSEENRPNGKKKNKKTIACLLI